ncbi:hypothetical protein MMC19_007516 [Ptychographa xylographoides]|nr:hypothetical protein [Ptychographa xylographoides]
MEGRFFNSPAGIRNKRLSNTSLADGADRHLREKTDAISHIIRNISKQCAAAVEGQLAHNAKHEEEVPEHAKHGSQHGAPSEDEEQSVRTDGSEVASETGYEEPSYLTPNSKYSSMPPTPGLDHDRSSTSMSVNSLSTTPDRSSQQYGLAPKISEGDDESEKGSEAGTMETRVVQKSTVPTDAMIRAAAARVV